MKKIQVPKIYLLTFLIIITVSVYAILPRTDPPIGFEIIDDTVEIWNPDATYYFNKTSGIQWTEDPDSFWTRNVFCLGFYNGSGWNKIACADELTGFERSIMSDNETYVNATLWKDITYAGYDMRLGIRYHLRLDDDRLSITVSGKNIDTEDFPFDIGFAWKTTDIQIGGTENDEIVINQTTYNLSDSLDLIFENMTHIYETDIDNVTDYIVEEIPFYRIKGIGENGFITFDWDAALDYKVKLYSSGTQSDAYVALFINAGIFNADQEKTTTFFWKDPDDIYEIYIDNEDNQHTIQTAWVGQTFTVGTTGLNESFTITKVGIKMYRSGSPGIVDVILDPVTTNGTGIPVLANLSTGSFDGATITTSSPGIWYNITMTPYVLEKGTQYTIYMRKYVGSGSDWIRWRTDSSSPVYTEGMHMFNVAWPPSWSPNPAKDHMFIIYGDPPAIQNLDILSPTTANPFTVTSGDNVTLNFTLTIGSNITADVGINNISSNLSEVVVFNTSTVVSAQTNIVIYRGGTTGAASYRLHNSTGWQTEITESAFESDELEWIETARHPTSDEMIMCYKDDSDDIVCEVWDGSLWGDTVSLTTTSATNDPVLDVCYEQSSGHAMVFYEDSSVDTSDVLYATWNGASWSATDVLLQDLTPGLPKVINCASEPGTDYIGIVTKDDDDDCWGIIWDGSSVEDAVEVESECSNVDGEDSVNGIWETSGEQFIVAYWEDIANEIHANIYTKLTGFAHTIPITGTGSTETIDVRFAADPTSDQILLAVADGEDDIEFNYWDGDSWQGESQLSADHGGTTQETSNSVYLAYEGSGTEAIIVYGQGVTVLKYRNWSGSAWSGEGDLATLDEASDWIHLDTNPYSDSIMATVVGITNDVASLEWNGTSWESAWEVHETAGNDIYWNAQFQYGNQINTTITNDQIWYESGADGGWRVNVTLPIFANGLRDLTMNVSYSGSSYNDTALGALNYGVEELGDKFDITVVSSLNTSTSPDRAGEFGRIPIQQLIFNTLASTLADLTKRIVQPFTINIVVLTFAGHFETIVQSFTINSLSSRTFGVLKVIVQQITIDSLSAKFFVGFKTIVQSFTIDSLASRTLLGFRSVIQSFIIFTDVVVTFTAGVVFITRNIVQQLTINAVTASITGLFRTMVDQLAMNSVVAVTLGSVRNVVESATMNSIAMRFTSAFESIVQPFTINGIIFSFFAGFKTVVQPVNINSETNRFANKFETIVQPFTINTQIESSLIIVRTTVQQFTMFSLPYRAAGRFREVTQSFTIITVVKTNLNGFREVIQLIVINTLSDNFAGRTSNIVESFTINSVTLNTLGTIREVVQSFTIVTLVEDTFEGFRSVTEQFTITTIVRDTFGGVRDITQQFTINSLSSRFAGRFEIIVEQFTLSSVVFNTLGTIREVTQSFTLVTLVEDTFEGFRSVTEQFTITTIVRDIFGGFRDITQQLIINTLSSRFAGRFETIVEQFTINTLSSRFAGRFETIVEQFTINSISSRTAQFTKEVSESFTIDSIVSRSSLIGRTITQSLQIDEVIDRIVQFFRGVIDTIVINADINVTNTTAAGAADKFNVSILDSFNFPCSGVGGEEITIQLQVADTENLEDVHIYTAGAGTGQAVGNVLIKFDISSIPVGASIGAAKIYFNVTFLDGWENETTYGRIINQTWREEDTIFGALTTANHTTDSNFGNVLGWDSLEVTGIIAEEFSLGNSNFSVAMEEGAILSLANQPFHPEGNEELSLGYFGESPNHYINFESKEHTSVSGRPYLNITYSTSTSLCQSQVDTSVNRFKTIVEQFTINSISSRALDSFRDLIQQFTINSFSSRFIGRFEIIVEQFTINSVISNVLGTIRDVVQSFTLVTLVEDTFEGFRDITQQFTITTIVRDTFGGVRDITQQLQINTLIRNAFGSLRDVTQQFTINSLSSRFIGRFEEIVEQFTIDSIPSRVLDSFRDLIQQFTINSLSSRFAGRSEVIVEQFTINAIRGGFVGRVTTIVEFFNIDTAIDRMTSSIRTALQRIRIMPSPGEPSGTRSRFRTVVEQFTISSISSRMADSFREVIQQLQINAISSRLVDRFRDVTQQLQINSISLRFFEGFKDITQQIQFSSISSRFAGRLETIVEQFTINSISIRFNVGTRDIVQQFTINALVSRTIGSRNIIQESITISSEVDLRTLMFRNPEAQIVFNTISERTELLVRRFVDSIVINSMTNNIFGVLREVVQPFTINSLVTKAGAFRADIVQSFTINTIIDRTTFIVKIIVQRITIMTDLVTSAREITSSNAAYIVPDTGDVPYFEGNQSLSFGGEGRLPYFESNQSLMFNND